MHRFVQMSTVVSQSKEKCFFQNVRALSSPITPAEQASELTPAYQHLLTWFSTVKLDHTGKVHQILL